VLGRSNRRADALKALHPDTLDRFEKMIIAINDTLT
jgi:hypothetical protein